MKNDNVKKREVQNGHIKNQWKVSSIIHKSGTSTTKQFITIPILRQLNCIRTYNRLSSHCDSLEYTLSIEYIITRLLNLLKQFKSCYRGYQIRKPNMAFPLTQNIEHRQYIVQLLGFRQRVRQTKCIGTELKRCFRQHVCSRPQSEVVLAEDFGK